MNLSGIRISAGFYDYNSIENQTVTVGSELPAELPQSVTDQAPSAEEYTAPAAIRRSGPDQGAIDYANSYQPDAVSDTGDFGLMQINICNHRWLYEELGITDVMDPEQNIEAGLYILGRAFQKYDDPDKALMAYNMGDSGMKSAWSKGQHSSKYSRAVIETAQALKRKEH